MPYGKGTYGSKVGRPPKKKKARPTPKPNRKGVGATRKPMKPKKGDGVKITKKTVRKGKGANPKNKSIMNTPVKKIPRAIGKKIKQKVKNVMNNTPKQNIKKGGKMIKRVVKGQAKRAAMGAMGLGGVSSGLAAGRVKKMMKKRKK